MVSPPGAVAWTRRPSLFILMIVFFATIGLTCSIGQPFHQRCYGDKATTNVSRYESSEWLENSCRPCREPRRRAALNTTAHRPIHVVVQLTTPKLQPEFLSIASGLLAENVNVTLFYMNFDRPTTQEFSHILWEGVLAGVPCTQDELEHLRPTLSIQAINIPPTVREACSERLSKGTSYAESMQSCSVISSTNQYRAHTNAFFGDDDPLPMPDVLLTDFHGFGALTFAEKLGIPSIILSDETSFYESIGRTEMATSSTWQYMRSLPKEFLRSFLATKSFSDLNRMRDVLDLRSKRHLSGFWDVATSVFVIADRYGTTSLPEQMSHYPPLLHFSTPIISPCMTCRDRPPPPPKPNKELPGRVEQTMPENRLNVVVYLPEDFTSSQARQLLKGLHMARKSMRITTDETCNPENSKILCWPDQVDLQVKWLLTMEAVNHRYLSLHPLPNFVKEQDSSLYLDNILHSFQSAATSNEKTILVASCDSDARASLLLRIPTLCLPSTKRSKASRDNESNEAFRTLEKLESKDFAIQLIRFLYTLRNSPQEGANMPYYDDTDGDSLERAVTIIRAAGNILHNTGVTPTAADLVGAQATLRSRKLQQSFVSAIQRRGLKLAPRRSTNHALEFTLKRIACIILALACCLIAIRWVVPEISRYLRAPMRNMQRNQFKIFLEAFLARLPELENVLAAACEFWKDRERLRRTNHNSRDSLNGRQNGKTQTKSSGSKSSNGAHKKRMGKYR